jgi:hypothetical protein
MITFSTAASFFPLLLLGDGVKFSSAYREGRTTMLKKTMFVTGV